jgi:hypothetical protein
VKKKSLAVAVTLFASAMILAGNYAAQADDKHDDSDQAAFKKNTLPLRLMTGTIPITTTRIPIVPNSSKAVWCLAGAYTKVPRRRLP